MECGDSITNPICHECLKGEVIAWLADQSMKGDVSDEELERMNFFMASLIKRLDEEYPDSGIECIKCHQSILLCSYCFKRYIKDFFSAKGGDFPPLFLFTGNIKS